MSSESRAFVVQIESVQNHPNADRLDIAVVLGDYPVIVKRDEYKVGDRAVYIPVDMTVPTSDPRFAFLAERGVDADGYARIRAVKLRGVFSMGLLIPTEPGWEGDVTDLLQLRKYERTVDYNGGLVEHPPFFAPTYTDIEGFRKSALFAHPLPAGTPVVLTEKIHGANMRAVWKEGRLWVGSRTNWKVRDSKCQWWAAAERADLERRLAEHPDVVLFGECYGPVQDMKYGENRPTFVAFDAFSLKDGCYLDYASFLGLAALLEVPTVPVLFRGPMPENAKDLWAFAEGTTVLGNGQHVREGGVLRPEREMWDARLGRVMFKLVGQGYHLRKGA